MYAIRSYYGDGEGLCHGQGFAEGSLDNQGQALRTARISGFFEIGGPVAAECGDAADVLGLASGLRESYNFV